MKRFLVLMAWALVPILVTSSLAQTGDGYVGIYSDSLGTAPCASVPPMTAATLYVIAKTAGASASGITGAEFRIEVTNPTGWYLSYTAPGAANIAMGNPIDTDPDPNAGGGLNLGFPTCQVRSDSGQVELGTLSVFNASGGPTNLLVKRHSTPSNPDFACALFVECDAPYYTKICMTSSAPDSCTLWTQKTGLAAVDDPAYFVAALNEHNDPDPDPDPELPNNGPQLLAMFKAGVVSFPPGETRASLARTTIQSAQLATVLANHDVQVIAKAFPTFDLADTLGTSRTGESVRLMNYSRIHRLILPSSGDAEALRIDLRPLPEVLFVHHDGGVGLDGGDGACTFDSIPECVTTVTNCPNDSLFAEQWALTNWEQTGGICDADIDADGAWELTTGSVTVKIGILDRGIVAEHEDVTGKVSGEFIIPAIDHGTFVACIAAANSNNSKGVAGVDHNARLVSKRFNPDNSPLPHTAGFDSIIARKVREAATEGLHVLNNSWYLPDSLGVPGRFSHTVRAAFRDYYMSHGVAVASMGNAGLQGSPVQYPAAFPQGIIAVGATDDDDAIADFSSRGNHIDVAAPGVLVLSCSPQAAFLNTYNTQSGTSFAAPHVAGLAGLLFSYAELENDDVEQLIRLSADPKGPAGFDSLYGMGRINARAALDLLRLPNRLYNDEEVVGGTLQASDWQGEVTFLFPPPGIQEGRYYSFRHPVETTVTFPVTFQSPPHVWGRGVATFGYSTEGSDSTFDYVDFGMGWCGPVGAITASGCTIRTYVYSLRDSTGAHIAWAPTDAAHVKYAYSVLGELQATDAGEFTAREAVGSGPRLTSMNPLRSGGRFRVWLPSPAGTRLEIFDVSGRLVRLLHEGQMAAGTHDFAWDGTAESGRQAPSGLYFARLRAEDRVLSRKVVVLQ